MKKQKKSQSNNEEKIILRITAMMLVIYNVALGAAIDYVLIRNSFESQVDEVSRKNLDLVSTIPVIVTNDDVGKNECSETTAENYINMDASLFANVETNTDAWTKNDHLGNLTDEKKAEMEADEENSIHLEQITENSNTKERIMAAFNFLIEEGFTVEAASGVIGNMATESSFDPTADNGIGYYGLFQWNTSEEGEYWWYNVENWMEENGYEWDSFEGQLKAMLYCPQRGALTDERLEELKQLSNPEQAAELFAVYYEICVGGEDLTEYYNVGSYYQSLDLRKSEARIAYNLFTQQDYVYGGEREYYHHD